MDMKHLNKPLTNNQLNPSIFFINFNETRKISFISREPQNICLIGEQSDKMERITTKGTLMAKGGQGWCVFDKRSVVHLRWTPCFFPASVERHHLVSCYYSLKCCIQKTFPWWCNFLLKKRTYYVSAVSKFLIFISMTNRILFAEKYPWHSFGAKQELSIYIEFALKRRKMRSSSY